MDTKVNTGRVVLLGVVKNDAEKCLAVQTANKVKDVLSVMNYLILL
ncbi:MAG: BON domain-containing protein [Desulfovibrio sp.]|nr:BON domain-containing protein [Desulfovibrio sp.]